MYAVTFEVELGSKLSRALTKSLSDLPGFVNFVALEDDDGHVTGICIFEDLSTLNDLKQIVERWRLKSAPLSVSNVIAQKGL
ncbi:MAG: hypothetical protein WBW04_06775 [Nitrolancea sp.]